MEKSCSPKNVFLKNKLSIVQKIVLAGLFIALITVFQKIVAINYIAVIPFLRISFGGCALTIFASIFLGPWFGLLIGAAADIIGYFLFDPGTTGGFFPQITAIYALLGFLSYFVFVFVRFIKSKKLMIFIEYGVFATFLIAISIFFALNTDVTLYSTTYHFEVWQKVLIPCLAFVFLALLVLINYLINRHFKKKDDGSELFNVYQVSFACFIIEIVVMIIFGTLMKGSAFGFQTYGVILITQIFVGFFNIPLNTFLVSYIIRLTKRFY